MKRLLKKVALSLVVTLLGLCLFLLISVTVLLHSEGLSRWVLEKAVVYINEETSLGIEYAGVDGKLFYGITFQELNIAFAEDENADSISFQRLSLRWELLALLRKSLYLPELEAEAILLTLHPPGATDLSDTPDPQAALDALFQLPLTIDINAISVQAFTYAAGDTEISIQELDGELHLDQELLVVNDTTIRMAPAQIDISHISLSRDSELKADIDWQAVVSDLDLAGVLQVEGDLQALQIQHSLQQPLSLESQGSVENVLAPDTGFTFDFRHQLPTTDAAAIPMVDVSPWLDSLGAELRSSGSMEALALQARLQLSDDGELTVSGELLPSPLSLALDWQLNMEQVAGLPEALTLSALAGSGSVALQQLEEGLQTQLGINRLSAELNDYPLNVEAEFNFLDAVLRDASLDLQSAENVIHVAGMMSDELNIDWSIDAPGLSSLWPGLQGQLQGGGQLTGTLEAPQLVGNLTGRELVFSTADIAIRVGSIDLNADAGLTGGELSLNAGELALAQGEQQWQASALQLNAEGSPGEHEVDIDFSAPNLRLGLQFNGAMTDARWQGSLDGATIDSDYGNWRLQAPADISVSAEQAGLARQCWQMQSISVCGAGSWQRDAEASAALDIEGIPLAYLTRGSVLSETSLPELASVLNSRPAGILREQNRYGVFLPEHAFAKGELGATMEISTEDGSFDQLQGELILEPEGVAVGLVSQTETDGELITNIREFNISAQALSVQRQPGLWSALATLGVYQDEADGSGLQGQLELMQSLNDEGQLQGSALLDFPHLQWLEPLLPDIAAPRGHLHMESDIAGDLSRPLLQMELSLSDGGFRAPAAGIAVNGIEMNLRSDADNNFYYEGSALSGDGNLSISGEVLHPFRSAERQASFTIGGDKFRIMDLPGTVLDISPSLQLSLLDGVVDVTGEVHIPYLDVRIEEALDSTGLTAVNVSRDVVLADQPQQRFTVDATGDTGVPLRGRVEVILGDYVHLEAYGLDVQLDGDVLLEQELGRPLLVYGEVNVVEGAYELYGQRLETDRGQILFLGNPSNPALDVRAYREVDTTVVGIQLNGTLNNIQGQLYSVPSLPESEVLAMLVTGRSFGDSSGETDTNMMLAAIVNLGLEQGQGITNSVQSGLGVDTLELSGGKNLEDSYLGIGKYITSDLFMRYDIGLFDRESILTMIYTLTERISLEVASGISQSIDLTYTLEK